MFPAYVCVRNVGVCVAGSSVGKGVTEEEERKRVCSCMCCVVYVVLGCVSKGLEMLCIKVRVGSVFYSHKILVVGMGMLSTHGDSGSMATQCTLPMLPSVRGGC